MLYLLIILIIFIIIFLACTVNLILKSTITRKLHNDYHSLNNYINKGLFDESFFNSLQKETLKIKSFDDLELSATLVINENKTNKFIILVHGVSIGPIGSLKYLKMFYNLGFNVLIIDQRRHGLSQGKYSTYGYFERYDLSMWINYLTSKFGSHILLGLHGESMGAGTVMEVIPLNNNIRFVIEDCGYTNFYELMKYQAHYNYPKLLYCPLCISLFFANIMVKIKAKFSMKDVSPIKIISTTSIPIMFIHGKEDYFVPCYMCKELYDSKKTGQKEILLVDNANHATSYETNKTLYETKITEFINKILETTY